MKSIASALAITTALTCLLTTEASAQLKPENLKGRWQLVVATPTLEGQVKDYVDFAGYAPSRGQSMIDDIRDMRKARTPQLLVFTEDSMSFKGVEVFGASAELSYQIAGRKLNVTFNRIASTTGGAGAKASDLVPAYYDISLSGTTLTLKSGPITGYKKGTITYRFKRFTKVVGEMRAWKRRGGKTFQAKVVNYKSGTVILENDKGKQLKLSTGSLAPEDKTYLATLIKESK